MLTLACLFLACTQPLPTEPNEGPMAAQTVGDITVAYFCGNTFQFRNRSEDAVTLQWRVRGVHENGEVVLQGRGGAEYSETYLTTAERGPLQVFRDGRPFATVPNRHTPQCDVPVTDTTTPPLPEAMNLPADTSGGVLSDDVNPSKYYGNLYAVAFVDTASGTTIRNFLRAVNGTIIGGLPVQGDVGYYIIQVPERSTTWAGIRQVQDAMQARPGVDVVMPVAIREHIDVRGRYPILPSIAPSRMFWSDLTHVGTRPFVAIRAPMAWGCENGLDGGTPAPVIGIVDLTFDPNPAILAGALQLNPDPRALVPMSTNMLGHLGHGTGIAGIISSDPRVEAANPAQPAIAGMLWQSTLKLYQVGTTANQTPLVSANPSLTFFAAVGHARQNNVQVLSTSLAMGNAGDPGVVRGLRNALKKFLDGDEKRVFVFALGNDGITTTAAAVAAGTEPKAQALDRAVATLLLDPRYTDRILVVSSTDELTGALLTDSNVWTDAPSVAAPGERITTLLGTNQLAIQHGTSFAAAFVAGLAGQIVRLAPTLKGNEIVQAIRAGAAAPRFDPAIGGSVVPVNAGVAGVYQIDAYSSLQIAAKGTGAALCGNRLWSDGHSVFADRGNSAPERIITLPGQVGQIIPYHGGRKLVAMDMDAYEYHVVTLGANGTWSAPQLWDDDITGATGSSLSTYGRTHALDSVAFLSSQQVWLGNRFGNRGGLLGTLPAPRLLSSGSGSDVCVRQYRNNGQYDCYQTVNTSYEVRTSWRGNVTTLAEHAVLVIQDTRRYETTVQPEWIDCFTFQPATDASGCRFRWWGTGSQTLGTSIWRLDTRTAPNGAVDSIAGLVGREPASLTGSEDGGTFALSSGVPSTTSSYLNNCYTQFYTVVAGGPAVADPVVRPYSGLCEWSTWQGGFGAVQQDLAGTPEPSDRGFALRARLERAAGM